MWDARSATEGFQDATAPGTPQCIIWKEDAKREGGHDIKKKRRNRTSPGALEGHHTFLGSASDRREGGSLRPFNSFNFSHQTATFFLRSRIPRVCEAHAFARVKNFQPPLRAAARLRGKFGVRKRCVCCAARGEAPPQTEIRLPHFSRAASLCVHLRFFGPAAD